MCRQHNIEGKQIGVGLGVPLGHPFTSPCCVRERLGSRFRLQSLTRTPRTFLHVLRTLLFLPTVLNGVLARGQDSSAVAQLIQRIDQIQMGSEFDYFFDLDSVPVEVMQKLMTNMDFKGEANARSIHKFMADRGESYQATDEVFGDSPRRKFLFGRTNNTEMFFMYFHGGRGNHLHLVYVDRRDTLLISSFATLRNWPALKTLEFDGELEQVRLAMLKIPLVDPHDMKALQGKVYDELDLF